MQKNIVIAAAALLSVCFLQSCGNTDNHPNASELDTTMHPKAPKDSAGKAKMIIDNDLMYSMSSTMAKMKIIVMSGDFDLDFANMMILHHQAAIDMSRVEIAQGRDEQIKAMALDIITLQNAQIVQMQEFVLNYKTPVIKVAQITEKPNPLGATMKAMMDKMNNMPMTGNTDQDFVAMMIPHHRAAVKMAEDELKHGKNPALKKLAQQMVVDQNDEIEEFKAWVINHQ